MPTRDPHWPHRKLDYQSPVSDPPAAGFSGLQLIAGFFIALLIPPLAIFVSAGAGVRPLAIILLVCSVVGINVIALVNFLRPGRRAFAVGLWIGFAAAVALIVFFFLTAPRIT
jgi:hypothetical protein